MTASRQITALAFSPDGRALAAADDEGALAVWDLAQARRSGSVAAAHLGPVWALAYSQGAGSLLSSGAHAISMYCIQGMRMPPLAGRVA